MLLWTALCLSLLHGLLEILYGARCIPLQAFQTRQAAVCIEVSRQVDHPLQGILGLRVFPHLQIGVAEDAIGVTVGRIERDRLRGLSGCAGEVVSGIEDKGQVTPASPYWGRICSALPQRLSAR